MKNHELIKKLLELPPDLDVEVLYDYRSRVEFDHVYVANRGIILLVPQHETIPDALNIPKGATIPTGCKYWRTPAKGQPITNGE